MIGEIFLKMSVFDIYKNLIKNKITSESLIRLCIQYIKKKDKKFKSFLYLNEKIILKSSRLSDVKIKTKKNIGYLEGVPIGVKDLIVIKNYLSTSASQIIKNFISPYDSTIVQELKKEGAIILGKLNQDEFAMGSSNELSSFYESRNPWCISRTPGGSSGGIGTAVVRNFCFGGIGTDTGGSIRLPAMYCGLMAMRPTYGLVSRYGLISFASSLDQAGPMTKDIKSNEILLKTMTGYDNNDSTMVDYNKYRYKCDYNINIEDIKIGLPKEFFLLKLQIDVEKSLNNIVVYLLKRKLNIVKVSIPHTEYAVAIYYVLVTAEASSNLSRYDGMHYGLSLNNFTLDLSYKMTRGSYFGKEVKRRILLGTFVLSSDYYEDYYVRAQKVRQKLNIDYLKIFHFIDFICIPTSKNTAFLLNTKIDSPLSMYLNDLFTVGSSLAGLPSLSFHSSFSKNKLPIGLQFIGRGFSENKLYKLVYLLESNVNLKKGV